MSSKRMLQWISGALAVQCIALALISRYVAPYPDAVFEAQLVAYAVLATILFFVVTFVPRKADRRRNA